MAFSSEFLLKPTDIQVLLLKYLPSHTLGIPGHFSGNSTVGMAARPGVRRRRTPHILSTAAVPVVTAAIPMATPAPPPLSVPEPMRAKASLGTYSRPLLSLRKKPRLVPPEVTHITNDSQRRSLNKLMDSLSSGPLDPAASTLGRRKRGSCVPTSPRNSAQTVLPCPTPSRTSPPVEVMPLVDCPALVVDSNLAPVSRKRLLSSPSPLSSPPVRSVRPRLDGSRSQGASKRTRALCRPRVSSPVQS